MNRLAWLAILLFWILLGLWLSHKYICNRNIAMTDSSTAILGSEIGSDTEQDFFGFKRSSSDRPTSNADLDSRVSSMSTRLLENPSESVIITGRYDDEETNDTPFDDLGIARANSIKSWLMDNGVSPDQIELKSQISEDSEWSNDLLSNGISFNYGKVTIDSSSKSGVESGPGNNSSLKCGEIMTLHFYYNRAKFELTDDQSNCLENMLARIDENGATLYIAGHTDDEEYDEAELSLLRAKKVKDFLVQRMNANPASITIIGYGTERGLAENCSSSGRAQNRRVEISIR